MNGAFYRRLRAWLQRPAQNISPQPQKIHGTAESFLIPALLDAFPAPVLLLDARRIIVEANEAAREIFGARLKGHDLAQSLRHPAALEAATGVLRDGRHVTAQIVLSAPVVRHFDLHAMPVNPVEGFRVRAVMVLLDVTAAHQLQQMRADFVANVSHELRSPLAALAGFIETLKGAAKDDVAARARFLDIMEVEARRMGRLIDDLLSLSRVEASEHVRPKGEVNMIGLLQAQCDGLSLIAEKRGVTLDLRYAEAVPLVNGDYDQLSEVFNNLLENALKYGASGSPVTITAYPAERIPELGGKGVKISVQNPGEPIAPEHIPRLTERFYRADKARSREAGGTGLGLAIVKHIVNRHRGRLVIESSRENGTVFSVFLPVARDVT